MAIRQTSLVIVLLILATVVPPTKSETRRVWTLEPEIGYQFGYTRYDMSIYGLADSAMPTVNGVRSLLEYPLDVFTAGARLCLKTQRDEKHRWGLSAGAFVNVNDPRSVMKDHDWYHQWTAPDFKFSYTESEADLSGYLVIVEGTYGVATGPRTWFEVTAGYRHQRIVQDISGYNGWQINHGVWDTLIGLEPALYYRVIFHSPSVGMRLITGDPNKTTFRIEGSFVPTYISDYDDHVIRHKSATASGWGEGGRGAVGLKVFLKREPHSRPYLDVSADILYITGSLKQVQTYYGDDPGTSENETGLVYSNVPHKITTLQYGIRARLGIEF